MKFLIVGQGGREHALAWKLAQSAKVTDVYVAPGNAGTAAETKVKNVAIEVQALDSLIQFAKENAIDLTLIGPEAPLALGIVDRFQAAGLPCFGPQQACAKLESSKQFAKDFMQQFAIPTAEYASFDCPHAAKTYLDIRTFPIVIKADGLAAGKGVVIAHTKAQAYDAVDAMLVEAQFGQAGGRIVIEAFLVGEELSFMVMCDGENVVPLASSQDHKARDDGDKGPNTGGMGAYSPAPVMDEKMEQYIMESIIKPTLKGMQTLGHRYTGFLYAGIMVTAEGPKVLEYNCRFGDPETQAILMRLKTDFAELCWAASEQALHSISLHWDKRSAVGVVLAAKGYPGAYTKGEVIRLPHQLAPDTKVFHAGTCQQADTLLTNGGRVLCVVALADTVKHAQHVCYQQIQSIDWPNMAFRRDIGHRAIAREKS